MCGFIVIKALKGKIDIPSFEAGLRTLERRGPDGVGTWMSQEEDIIMGHTRLSIIDLAGGAQPIANEDKTLWSVVNGEFYEHDRILNDLASRQHILRSRSDSEMLVHLYEDLGLNCFEILRGEFAFTLWDATRQRVFAARDRFGIKPIYYAIHADKLYIASEIKAILAAGVPAQWDEKSLYDSFHIMVRQNCSIFKGIQPIPPGHYLLADERGVRVQAYWDAQFSSNNQSEALCTQKMTDLLTQAIHIRTRADVPIACYLSGGVDSASVLGIASSLLAKKITAFTISFDHVDFDERAKAEEMARFAGVDFHPIHVTDRDFADKFESAVSLSEMFVFNSHAPARYILSEKVSKAGFKVVLGGEGGDEVFAGYEFLQKALQNQAQKSSLLDLGRRIFAFPDSKERRIFGTSPLLAMILRIIGLPDHLATYLHDKVFTMKDLLAPEFEKQFKYYDPYFLFLKQFPFRSLRGKERFRQLLYFWLKSAFVNYVLAGERLDMANGVELRLPFLDHRLFEFASQVPGKLLYKNGINKYLLRKIAKPYVTENIRRGDKKPFIGPSAMRLDSPLYQLFQDTLRSQEAKNIAFIDWQALQSFLDKTSLLSEKEREKYDPLFFMLSSFVILQKHYRISQS